MDKATEIWLNRLDRDYQGLNSRLDAVDTQLGNLENDIAEIKGTIKPKELPWGVRFILFPLTVAALLGLAGAVIHLEIVVAGMGKNIAGVQGEQARQIITTDAALSASEFDATLPGLASAIAVTRRQKLKVSPKIISDLQQHLIATDADANPNFWTAASEFITYKSFNSASWSVPRNLPTCTDSPPTPTTMSVMNPTQMKINPGLYENCQFILDSPEQDARLNAFLTSRDKGAALAIVFKHCIIVYRGGPINLIMALQEHNVSWSGGTPEHPVGGTVNISVDHTFDIALHDAPPQSGRQLTQFLLANTDTTVSFQLSTQS